MGQRRRYRNESNWIDRAPQPLDEGTLVDEWADVLARRGSPGFPETLAAYVHVPYCHTACSFCMYFMSALSGLQAHYVDYVVERLARLRRRVGRVRASSLYIGGGTPTVLPHDELARLLDAVNDTFDVEGDATMEAHPRTLDADKIALVLARGVNRLSMGVQSTEPAVLEAINRINPAREEMVAQVRLARQHGAFVNLDLVIGLPQQTREGLESDIRWALSAHPRCITVYRYQPVPHLPPPAGGLRYSDLDWTSLMQTAVVHGFAPLKPRRSDSYCATFLRLIPHRRASLAAVARRALAFGHLFRSGALHRPLPARARVHHFTGFDIPSINVCGFGPGAISHLFGRAWYRDTTRPADARAGRSPELTGNRISLDEELRRAVAADFAMDRWVDAGHYGGSIGLDPGALLTLLPVALAPAIERRGRRIRLRADHRRASDVLSWLVPGAPVRSDLGRSDLAPSDLAPSDLAPSDLAQLRRPPQDLKRRGD